jgi:hypothetical protein
MHRVAGITVGAVFAVALAIGAARADRLTPRPDFLTTFALETFGRAPLGAPAFATPASTLERSRDLRVVRLDGLQRSDAGALKGLAFHGTADDLTLASRQHVAQAHLNLPASTASPLGAALPAIDTESFARAFASRTTHVNLADVAFRPSTETTATGYTPSGSASISFVNLAGLEHAVSAPAPSENFAPLSGGAISFASLRSDVQFGGASLGAGLPNAYVSGIQLREDRLAAGTGFDVRAGNRKVNVQLGTSYDRLTRSDAATFSYVPAPTDALDQGVMPTAQSLLAIPGAADLTRRQINASLAVPVTSNLTLGLQYNTQRYNGTYGAVIVPNVDTRNDAYLGKLSYSIPRTSSVITFSARQLRFQDNLAPSANSWQLREDVKLTVKF